MTQPTYRTLVENDLRSVEVSFGGRDIHNEHFLEVPNRAEVLELVLCSSSKGKAITALFA